VVVLGLDLRVSRDLSVFDSRGLQEDAVNFLFFSGVPTRKNCCRLFNSCKTAKLE